MKSHLPLNKKLIDVKQKQKNNRYSSISSWANQVGILDLEKHNNSNDFSLTPAASLRLQWVHGCSTRITRNAVR